MGKLEAFNACKNVGPGLFDCQKTLGPAAYEQCKKAQAGFEDCYAINQSSECFNALSGFKTCYDSGEFVNREQDCMAADYSFKACVQYVGVRDKKECLSGRGNFALGPMGKGKLGVNREENPVCNLRQETRKARFLGTR
jgi:hypothetical protein